MRLKGMRPETGLQILWLVDHAQRADGRAGALPLN
jgi:hypothetical protein